MNDFRYYRVNLNRLESCGTLLELISKFVSDLDLFSRLRFALTVYGKYKYLSQLLAIPKYLMSKACSTSTHERIVNPIDKGYIAVIGEKTPTFYQNFQHPLHHYTNSWDLLMSFEVKKRHGTNDVSIICVILWNMSLCGYPGDFESFSLIDSNLISLNNYSEFYTDKIKNDLYIVPFRRFNNCCDHLYEFSFYGNYIEDQMKYSRNCSGLDYNYILSLNDDDDKCCRIFFKGSRKGERCSNQAISDKEYQQQTSIQYKDYFFPTKIECDIPLFCQECLNNLYVRIELTSFLHNFSRGFSIIDYPKSVENFIDENNKRIYLYYIDIYGWVLSSRLNVECNMTEYTILYTLDNYPRALNSREKEMAKRMRFFVVEDTKAIEYINKIEYPSDFINNIISLQRRYKEKIYSDINFVFSQIKGKWDKL